MSRATRRPKGQYFWRRSNGNKDIGLYRIEVPHALLEDVAGSEKHDERRNP
jgi:hypothetical protein